MNAEDAEPINVALNRFIRILSRNTRE
jgi:hypothetical protein